MGQALPDGIEGLRRGWAELVDVASVAVHDAQEGVKGIDGRHCETGRGTATRYRY